VTFDRAQRLRRTVATMPLDLLLLETDAPDQPAALRRGQRNEPAFLGEVLETVASLRGVAPEIVAAATAANARRLFGP
jgi:TatD DNase family protein